MPKKSAKAPESSSPSKRKKPDSDSSNFSAPSAKKTKVANQHCCSYTEKKKPPDPEHSARPTYQTIKTSLKCVAGNAVVIEKLQEATKRANSILTHGLQFLKLYFLHLYEKGLPFPELTKDFVSAVLKAPCQR